LSVGEELALCQRYYETTPFSVVTPTTATGQIVRTLAYYKVSKRINPSLILNSGYLGGFGTPTVNVNGNTSVQVQAISISSNAGSEFSGTVTADAEIY